MPRSPLGESIDLLRTRRFGTFWFASLLSNIGTWAQQVAQPWLLLSLGASSFLLGVDSFALSGPVLLLTIAGGILADRADRRRVIAGFQSVQMLCPVLLVILLLAGAVQPWMVIVLSLVVGITDALSMPSFQSIVPSLVERRKIRLGLALNSTQFNLSRILGPSIAGVLMAAVGAVGCFALSAASYVPFIAVALWILPRRQPLPEPPQENGAHHPFSGIGAILKVPHLRGALLTVLATSTLCGPLITFSPVLVKEIHHGDATQFSAVLGAFGIGGLIGAVGLLSVGARRDLRLLSSSFAVGYAAVVALVVLNPWYWGFPALMVLAGLSMNVSNTAANSALQTAANPLLRGQTVSLFMLAMRGGLAVGSLVTGMTVTFLGVRHALLVNGLLAMAIQIFVGRNWLASLPPPEPPS
jgi:predicted MFS family arabinose efflux permease